MIPQAQANHVTPTVVPGNPDCSQGDDFKIDDTPTNGTHGSITITGADETDGHSFDFTSTELVIEVIVKGGNNANVYDYSPEGTLADTGLVAPDNKGEQQPQISHVTFCFGGTGPTTTTTEAETTTTTETEVEATTTTETETETVVGGVVIEADPTPPPAAPAPEVAAEVLAATGPNDGLLVLAGAFLVLGGLAIAFAGPTKELELS
jgi:hypothetical protein